MPFVRLSCLALLAALGPVTLVEARPALRPWPLPIQDAAGLLSPDVTAIDGDAQGRIWFATSEGGASRYDPRDGSWLTLAEGYGLHDTQVLDVLVDSRGDVWFATVDDGVHRLRAGDGGWDRFGEYDGAVADALELLEDRRGWIWAVGFDGGLSRYEPVPGTWTPLANDDDAFTYAYHDIAEGVDGVLWARGTRGIIAYLPDEDRWRHVWGSDRIRSEDTSAMFPGADGGLWIGGWLGSVGYIDRPSGTYREVVPPTERATERCVDALLHTREGEIWVGTSRRGVHRLDPETGRWRDVGPYGADEWGPAFLVEDRAGDIWAGTWGANVRRFDADSRAWFQGQAPLVPASSAVTAVYEDRRGVLWFGTRGEGALRHDPGTGEWSRLPMRTDGTLGGDVINSVSRGHGEEIWFSSGQTLGGVFNGTGIHGGGLHRFDLGSGTWITYRSENGLDDPNSDAVVAVPGGEVIAAGLFGIRRLEHDLGRWSYLDAWFMEGGARGLVLRADGTPWALTDSGQVATGGDSIGNNWRTFPVWPTFGGHRIQWLTPEPSGDLWAGLGEHGLARLSPGADVWERCSTDTLGIEDGVDIHLSVGPGGERWAWDQEGRAALLAWDGAPPEWCEPPPWVRGFSNSGPALVDAHGGLWVGYRHATVRFDADGARMDVFTESDGLVGDAVDDGIVDAHGALWLSDSFEGVTRIEIDERGPHRPLAVDGFSGETSRAALTTTRSGAVGGVCWARPSGLMWTDQAGAVTHPLSPAREWNTALAGGEAGCWAGHFLSGVVFAGQDGDLWRFGVAEGLPDPLVLDLSIVPGTGGARVWAATNDGAALVDMEAGVLTTVGVDDGGSPGAVDRILALPDAGALLVYDDFDTRWFLDPDAWPEREVLHLLWVSAEGEVGLPVEIPADDVLDLAVDGAGVVWLATDVGLFRSAGVGLVHVPAPLPSIHVPLRHVAVDPSGEDPRVWLALDGGEDEPAHLVVHDPVRGSWETLTTADGLPEAVRIDMLEVTPGGEAVVMAGGQLVRGRGR